MSLGKFLGGLFLFSTGAYIGAQAGKAWTKKAGLDVGTRAFRNPVKGQQWLKEEGFTLEKSTSHLNDESEAETWRRPLPGDPSQYEYAILCRNDGEYSVEMVRVRMNDRAISNPISKIFEEVI